MLDKQCKQVKKDLKKANKLLAVRDKLIASFKAKEAGGQSNKGQVKKLRVEHRAAMKAKNQEIKDLQSEMTPAMLRLNGDASPTLPYPTLPYPAPLDTSEETNQLRMERFIEHMCGGSKRKAQGMLTQLMTQFPAIKEKIVEKARQAQLKDTQTKLGRFFTSPAFARECAMRVPPPPQFQCKLPFSPIGSCLTVGPRCRGRCRRS